MQDLFVQYIILTIQHVSNYPGSFFIILSGCFRLSVSSRRLSDPYISSRLTAYSLDECKTFCLAAAATSSATACTGFAYRRPLGQGEILNCDLTREDPTVLDQYNSYHFLQSAVTDFYERLPAEDCSSSLDQDGAESSGSGGGGRNRIGGTAQG